MTNLEKKIENYEDIISEMDKNVDIIKDWIMQNKKSYLTFKETKDPIYQATIHSINYYIELSLNAMNRPSLKQQFYKLAYYYGEINPKAGKKYIEKYQKMWKK